MTARESKARESGGEIAALDRSYWQRREGGALKQSEDTMSEIYKREIESGELLSILESIGEDTMSEREIERAARERERERRIAARLANNYAYANNCNCGDCARIARDCESEIDYEIESEIARESGIEIESENCEQCRRPIFGRDLADMRIIGGDAYHDRCSEDRVFCDQCGIDCGRREYYQRESGDPLCAACFVIVWRSCDICGDYERRDLSPDLIISGIEICEDCLIGIEICEDCGDILQRRSHYDPDSGDPLCGGCYNERERERERKQDRARIAAKIESGEYKKISLPGEITSQCAREIERLLDRELEAARAAAVAAAIEGGEGGPSEIIGNRWINIDRILGGREIVNSRGKIAKRIRNNMRREHGIAISPAVISEIGNLANNYSFPGGDHVIEITSDLMGTVGKFGDASSCFQPGGAYHSNLLAMIASDRCEALRVYSSEGDRVARAWIYNGRESGENYRILFNAYGERLNKIADIMAAAIGGDPRPIDLNADIYINSSEGIIFGGGEDRRSYEIEIQPGENCEDCERFLPEGEAIDYEGDPYCYSCYHDRFVDCERCDLTIDRDDAYYEGGANYCEDCEGEIMHNCERCGDRFLREGESEIGGDYCEDCASEIVYYCEDCGDLFLSESGGDFCEDCESERERESGEDCVNYPGSEGEIPPILAAIERESGENCGEDCGEDCAIGWLCRLAAASESGGENCAIGRS